MVQERLQELRAPPRDRLDPWGDGKTSVRAASAIHDRIFDNLRRSTPHAPALQSRFRTASASPTQPTPLRVSTLRAHLYQWRLRRRNPPATPIFACHESQAGTSAIQRDLFTVWFCQTTYVGNHSTPPNPQSRRRSSGSCLVQPAIAACVANDPTLCQPGESWWRLPPTQACLTRYRHPGRSRIGASDRHSDARIFRTASR